MNATEAREITNRESKKMVVIKFINDKILEKANNGESSVSMDDVPGLKSCLSSPSLLFGGDIPKFELTLDALKRALDSLPEPKYSFDEIVIYYKNKGYIVTFDETNGNLPTISW